MNKLDISTNVESISRHLIEFIATYAENRGNDSALIWFSGYIDSTIIVKLATEALGAESIKCMVRSDKYTNIQEEIFNMSVEFLGLTDEQIVKCDIEPFIKKLSSEVLLPRSSRRVSDLLYEPLSYALLKHTTVIEDEGKSYSLTGKPGSGREELIYKVIAQNKLRSRMHMAFAYLTAETENRFLIGTINKSELLTGLFTKWGKGHSADIMPLGNLYRTQILQLADYLDVPQSISSLAKADLLPGIENKYLYFFDLSAFDVDKILAGFESGSSIQQISEQHDIPSEKIQKVKSFLTSSQFARAAPGIPRL